MKDVQGELDRRNIPLKHVGIKDLRWPIALKDKERGTQNTVATVSLAVDLPHDLRGTHMSRFVECLQTLGPVTLGSLENILDHLKDRLQAEKAFLQLNFHILFIKRLLSAVREHRWISIVFIRLKRMSSFHCAFLRRFLFKPCAHARKRSALMALITKELWLNWKLDLLKWFGWKNWLLLLMQEQARLFTVF